MNNDKNNLRMMLREALDNMWSRIRSLFGGLDDRVTALEEGGGTPGPQGPKGDKGDKGDPGDPATNIITGVKGNAENSYRTGNVNLTPANIGAVPTDLLTIDDCDNNTLTGNGHQIHYYRVVSTTRNSPYAQGLSGASSEFLMLVFGNNNYTTQICYTLSGLQFYIRCKAGSNSQWNGKTWTPSVLGIKGNAESSYRTGNVNLTPENIGAISQRVIDAADITQADNAIPEGTIARGTGFYVYDKNNRAVGGVSVNAQRDGRTAISLYTNNVVDGNMASATLQINLDKNNLATYVLSNPAGFRAAISAQQDVGFYVDAQGYLCQRIRSDT